MAQVRTTLQKAASSSSDEDGYISAASSLSLQESMASVDFDQLKKDLKLEAERKLIVIVETSRRDLQMQTRRSKKHNRTSSGSM